MTPHRHVKTFCPNCGKPISAAMSVVEAKEQPPRPGDMAVCFDCHHVSIFGEDLTLHSPTDAEIVNIAGDSELLLAMEMLGEFKRRLS